MSIKSPIAAIFDIDGTLVRCTTQVELAKVCLLEGRLTFRIFIQILIWKILYGFKILRDSNKIRRVSYRAFRRMGKDDLKSLIGKAMDLRIIPKLNSVVVQALDKHKALGHRIIVISGTLQELCNELCCRMAIDIDDCYATTLVIKDGRYTGDWVDPILEGEDKMKFVAELAKNSQIDLGRSYAYCDHNSDISLLRIIGHPVVVGKDKELVHEGRAHRWQHIDA